MGREVKKEDSKMPGSNFSKRENEEVMRKNRRNFFRGKISI